jgi:hypothetical protein
MSNYSQVNPMCESPIFEIEGFGNSAIICRSDFYSSSKYERIANRRAIQNILRQVSPISTFLYLLSKLLARQQNY